MRMGVQERGRETGKGAGQGGARVAVKGQQYQNTGGRGGNSYPY